MSAHAAGDIEAARIVVAGNHERGPGGPRHADTKAADGPAANHQNGAAGDRPLEHGMHRVSEGIHDRADLGGNSVQPHDI